MSMMAVLVVTVVASASPERPAMDTYHQRTRVAERCAARAAAGEIVVCGKRSSVYRLPIRDAEPGSRAAIAADAYGERLRLHGRAVDAGGIASCSAVGPGGGTGCTKGIGIVSIASGRTSFLPRPIDD